MGWRMVKQPNGLYARWTSVVDGFTHMNLTRADALAECRERIGALEAEEKVSNADAEPGRWEECLETLRVLKDDAGLEEALRLNAEAKAATAVEPRLNLDGVRFGVMCSEPQTLLCTSNGVGLATIHGNTRDEREQAARWIAARLNAPSFPLEDLKALSVLLAKLAKRSDPKTRALLRSKLKALLPKEGA